MPLTAEDQSRLYNDAFQHNAKAMLGESAFTNADLLTKLNVSQHVNSVLQDELTAAQGELTTLKAERDAEKAAEVPPQES